MAGGEPVRPHSEDETELPEETLADDEQPTPTWFPLLGLALALVALFAILVTRAPGDEEAQAAAAASASAAAAPAAPDGQAAPTVQRVAPDMIRRPPARRALSRRPRPGPPGRNQ